MEFTSTDLVAAYQATDEKPDKKYSILPTVLKLVGDIRGKTVLDLGCGSGFFTEALAEQWAERVIGIDNSSDQLELARKTPRNNIEYRQGDIFHMQLPKNDVIVAPFILNYAKNVDQLADLVMNLSQALGKDGKLIIVLDLPNQLNHTRFGAKKHLVRKQDGEPMTIELFQQEALLCELKATYYLPETVERSLLAHGFKVVTWHKAIIHPDGIRKYGEDFWTGYVDDPELGYVSALKV